MTPCFLVQLLDFNLNPIGFLRTSFHKIDSNEYSANVRVVQDMKYATCVSSIAEAWRIAEFVVLHLFAEHHYTFRVIDHHDVDDYTTYLPENLNDRDLDIK